MGWCGYGSCWRLCFWAWVDLLGVIRLQGSFLAYSHPCQRVAEAQDAAKSNPLGFQEGVDLFLWHSGCQALFDAFKYARELGCQASCLACRGEGLEPFSDGFVVHLVARFLPLEGQLCLSCVVCQPPVYMVCGRCVASVFKVLSYRCCVC